MSNNWIESVKHSGRFSGKKWSKDITVRVTTLDELIYRFGQPDFVKIVKIDVEGFEQEVIEGLTSAVKALSLEYAAENHKALEGCLNRMDQMGSYSYKFSMGESMEWEFAIWQDKKAMLKFLDQFRGDFETFGDVYLRKV